jgi:hypothetical protein
MQKKLRKGMLRIKLKLIDKPQLQPQPRMLLDNP